MKLTIIAAAATVALITAAPHTSAQTNSDQRFETCKAKLKRASELQVLYAFDWKPPKAPYVVAGPTFLSMPIDGKEGFAETVNCFLNAGEQGKCVNFDILHWQTGRAVGSFRNCRYRHGAQEP